MQIKKASRQSGRGKWKADRSTATLHWRQTWLFTGAILLALSTHLPAQQIASGALPEEPVPQGQIEVGAPSQTPSPGGSIAGSVIDETGAAITSATVRLSFREPALSFDTKTDSGGGFSFPSSRAGAFVITVSAPGFMTFSVQGSVSAGQVFTLPPVTLHIGSSSEIEVGMTRVEMAQEQLNTETKQRFLGVIPNYYMSYDPNPLPLTAKQKFTLAGRFALDPVSFGLTGLTAEVQQANNDYSGFGKGAGGYGKRYAADTGSLFNDALIAGAILPSILHQDPRYFYKGTGTIKSRTLYAIANTVVCKGDNGHWQFNASSIGGGLAASAISNFYYPAANRDGADSIFVNAAIGLAEEAAGNIAQEFLFKRLTSHTKQPKLNP